VAQVWHFSFRMALTTLTALESVFFASIAAQNAFVMAGSMYTGQASFGW
jgi:hypothetical protein